MNKYHLSVILGCIAAMFVTAYFFNDLFSITRVSPQCIMLFVVFALAEECVMRYLTMLSDRLGALNAKRKAAALEKEQKN
jgi:cation-transporting ATPase E